MNKSLKQGIQFIVLAIYLVLILHYLDMASYFVFLIAQEWVPPKDQLTGETIIYTNYKQGYAVMLYYGALFLLSNDPSPYTMGEVAGCFFFLLIGSLTLGILIA
jgi:hypothetical protein